jgi:hypothetical protein
MAVVLVLGCEAINPKIESTAGSTVLKCPVEIRFFTQSFPGMTGLVGVIH